MSGFAATVAIERRSARSTMRIVRAQAEDAEALTAIAFAAKRHWGYPERWIQSWRDVLTMRPDVIEGNPAWCALEEDRPIGFYVLTAESDGLHLDHLWVLPQAMGRGVARALFQHAAGQAKALGHSCFKIEADPNAEGFYRRMGAKRTGSNRTEVEGQLRELPLLQYDLGT